MHYISTREQHRCDLRQAARRGIAPDGGLYVPERMPAIDPAEAMRRAARSFPELAAYLAGHFFGDTFSPGELLSLTRRAYPFSPRLKQLDDRLYTLELFHGPTFAFKDFGARFMGAVFEALNPPGDRLTVLAATSGDTGSAVAGGFYRVPGVRVVLLYPAGRISELQESQMTTLGDNIRPISVAGSFDDCQRIVKAIFAQSDFCQCHGITSANSINILRWIPQSFYYYYGTHLWQQATGRPGAAPRIAVPSGNYGNLAAGMLAARTGLPVDGFIAASNANDIIPEYLQNETFRPRESTRTLANAMDVGNPSNFERMQWLCGHDFGRMKRDVSGFSATDEAIRQAIAQMKTRYDYLSDPHSAVGYLAATRFGIDGFWLSTAHEAKFREILGASLPAGTPLPELPAPLARCLALPKIHTSLPAKAEAVRAFIERL